MTDGRRRDIRADAERARQARITMMAREFFVTVSPYPGDELLWPALKPTFEGFVRVALAFVEARRKLQPTATVKYSADGVKIG